MYYVIVRHQVPDYETWRPAFEADQEYVRGQGIHDPQVLRCLDHPDEVTIQFLADDLQKARDFFTSEHLKQRLAEQHVPGEPEVHFLEED